MTKRVIIHERGKIPKGAEDALFEILGDDDAPTFDSFDDWMIANGLKLEGGRFEKAEFGGELTKNDGGPYRVAVSVEGALARAVSRALDWMRGSSEPRVLDAINENAPSADQVVPETLLEGRIGGALDLLDRPFDAGVRQVLNDNTAIVGRDKIIDFDLRRENPRVRAALADHRVTLIREIADEQRSMVQSIIDEALGAGDPPAAMARRIRDVVGLTERQAASVANYRRDLEALSPAALTRALRDARFDGPIRRAIEGGEILTGDKINRYVDAYRRRYVAYRATVIARTESIRAANLGMIASTQAMAADAEAAGLVVVKRWIATNDAKTRPDHRALDGQQVVGFDTPFTVNGRTIRFPHDPEAPADLTVQCRCTCSFKLMRPEDAQF